MKFEYTIPQHQKDVPVVVVEVTLAVVFFPRDNRTDSVTTEATTTKAAMAKIKRVLFPIRPHIPWEVLDPLVGRGVPLSFRVVGRLSIDGGSGGYL